MIKHQECYQAWLLHSRPYRESSLLLDFLTLEAGRVSVISRGQRTRSGSGKGLQPFLLYQVTVAGRSHLKTLKSVEPVGHSSWMTGKILVAALYANELVVSLLGEHESDPGLFQAYTDLITTLGQKGDIELALRHFELVLLESLGYGIDLHIDALTGQPIEAEKYYYLGRSLGLVPLLAGANITQELESAYSHLSMDVKDVPSFLGKDLIALSLGDLSELSTRRTAKLLLRQAIQHQLGDRQLNARNLLS
jgi:DNA repair protein RecO (recombination protein O)